MLAGVGLRFIGTKLPEVAVLVLFRRGRCALCCTGVAADDGPAKGVARFRTVFELGWLDVEDVEAWSPSSESERLGERCLYGAWKLECCMIARLWSIVQRQAVALSYQARSAQKTDASLRQKVICDAGLICKHRGCGRPRSTCSVFTKARIAQV